MSVNNKYLKSRWRNALILSLISVAVLLVFMVYREIKVFKANQTFYEKEYLEQSKGNLKREVRSRIDEIYYIKNNLKKNEKSNIKNKILDIENSINKHIKKGNLEQTRNIGLDIVINYAQNDKDYLYFVLDLEGNLYLSGANKDLQGKNLISLEDIKGKKFIKEIVDSVKDNGEAYVSYYWPKIKDGKPLLKISYCKYIDTIDAVVGTGVYIKDIEEMSKKELYNMVQSFYRTGNDYIFMTTYDGMVKVSGNLRHIDSDFSTVKDLDGEYIHDKFMKIVDNTGSGYILYSYYQKNDLSKKYKKISYIEGIDDWQIYIGMGFYLNDFYNKIEDYNKKSLNDLAINLIIIISIILLLGFIVISIINRTIKDTKEYIKREEVLYEKFVTLTNEGIIIYNLDGNIEFANPFAKELLEIRDKDNMLDYNINDFLFKNDTYYKVTGINGKESYVSIQESETPYKEDYYIVIFMRDITKKLKYEEKLKNTAFTDYLTMMPNRRKLFLDLKALLNIDDRKLQKISIALLDLDNFKKVNDTYGHEIGDEVLKKLGEVFDKNTRKEDVIYRYGGEEFIAILKDVGIHESKEILEKTNKAMYEYEWKYDGLKTSFSAGLIEIELDDKMKNIDEYLKQLDVLLYHDINNGKNRVEIPPTLS